MSLINGSHVIIYAEDAERARRFFRDVLDLRYVDAHDGWLIFKLPPAELGIHPTAVTGDAGVAPEGGHHEMYLMCDDVESAVVELSAKGVEFTSPVEDQGFGRLTRFRVPGAGEIGLYQPKHETVYDL